MHIAFGPPPPSWYMSLIVFVWWPKPSFWSVSWYILSHCICLITSSNMASARVSCFYRILLWPASAKLRPGVPKSMKWQYKVHLPIMPKLQPLHTSIHLAQRQDRLIYVGLHGTPGALGGPYHEITLNYGHFGYFSRSHASDVPHQKHVTKFVGITSFDDAMTSYVMSPHCMCIGHVTIYYKRLPMPWLFF